MKRFIVFCCFIASIVFPAGCVLQLAGTKHDSWDEELKQLQEGRPLLPANLYCTTGRKEKGSGQAIKQSSRIIAGTLRDAPFIAKLDMDADVPLTARFRAVLKATEHPTWTTLHVLTLALIPLRRDRELDLEIDFLIDSQHLVKTYKRQRTFSLWEGWPFFAWSMPFHDAQVEQTLIRDMARDIVAEIYQNDYRKFTVEAESFFFEKTKRKNTVESLNNYLTAYPDGKHRETARRSLSQLHFRKARAAGTTEALKNYLAETPPRDLAAAAQKEIAALDLVSAVRNESPQGLHSALKRGADLKKASIDGEPPLLLAAKQGNMEMIGLLLKAGTPVDIPGKGGCTALERAITCENDAAAVALIKAGAALDRKTRDHGTLLMAAAAGNRIETVRELLKRNVPLKPGNNREWTALAKAAVAGHMEVVKLLLLHGANPDVSVPSGYSRTPKPILTLVDQEKYGEVIKVLKEFSFFDAAAQGDLERIDHFLDLGRNVDFSDAAGRTALYKAAENGHIEAIRLLLKNGACFDRPVTISEREKLTPAKIAARNCHTKTIREFLRLGTALTELVAPYSHKLIGSTKNNLIYYVTQFSAETAFQLGTQQAIARYILTPKTGTSIIKQSTQAEIVEAARQTLQISTGSSVVLSSWRSEPEKRAFRLKAAGSVDVKGFIAAETEQNRYTVIPLSFAVQPEGNNDLSLCWLVSTDVSMGRTKDKKAVQYCRNKLKTERPDMDFTDIAVFKMHPNRSLSLLP